MLTGKAYERAISGHFLFDDALNALVVKKLLDAEYPETNPSINHVIEKFDQVLALSETVIQSSDVGIANVDHLLMGVKDNLKEKHTGKLWIQYMNMVGILRSALRAQSTGEFILYLKSIQNMLPYFAASGHNNYTKSIHLHLKDMISLQVSNSYVFSKFVSGQFFVRRSDLFWAGLPSDLIIEQVLMKSLNSAGGLTHGRGINKVQLTRRLQSMPVFAQIHTMITQQRNDFKQKNT